MLSPTPTFKKPTSWINWNGRLGKLADFWGKYQKWWWIFVAVFMMVSFAYDIGRVVTRSEILSGSQNVKGSITVQQAIQKSTNAGGRLLITSNTEARFIDSVGHSWNIPNFSKTATQLDMEQFKKNQVGVDGVFSINVRPVKTRPADVWLTTLSELLARFLIIGLYALIFYFIMRYIAGQKKGRFNKVVGEKATTKIVDVAGYEGVKTELVEVVQYLRDPERFSKLGAHPPRGVLLYGPPGTGKTLLAKAVAGEAAASFYEQSASSFVQIYAGEGAKAVRQLFEQARKNAPAVIFIDEIDAVGGARSGGSHDERVQTLNAILTEMSGFGDNKGIVVVAATNRLETLDDALVRSGRFDRKVYIGLPSTSDREKILKVHAAKVTAAEDVDWTLWAAQTRGFSGADLAALVNEAAIEAARANKNSVENSDIAKARDRVWIGAKNHGQVLSDEERNIVAVHEMGHAFMRLQSGGRVEKVSIAPRGQSLGVTVSVMDSDKYLLSKEDVHKELLTMMGGRAAEMVVFGRVTGGAADDMARASNLARETALRIGTEKWGAYIPQDVQQKFVDDEASKMVNMAYEEACSILKSHQQSLERASKRLQESDEMNEQEMKQFWPM